MPERPRFVVLTGLSGSGKTHALRFLEDAGWIAAWAPGTGADRFRAGTGVSLPAGSRIVMQVHYNLLNGRRPDRSRAALTTVPAAKALTPVETMLLPAPVELSCRPGESGPLCDRTAAVFDQVDRFGADSAIVPSGLLLICGRDAAHPVPSPVTTCDRPLGRSVTSKEIAQAIQEARGLKIDRKRIKLDEGIREVGTYMVEIEVPGGATASVKTIVAEQR